MNCIKKVMNIQVHFACCIFAFMFRLRFKQLQFITSNSTGSLLLHRAFCRIALIITLTNVLT